MCAHRLCCSHHELTLISCLCNHIAPPTGTKQWYTALLIHFPSVKTSSLEYNVASDKKNGCRISPTLDHICCGLPHLYSSKPRRLRRPCWDSTVGYLSGIHHPLWLSLKQAEIVGIVFSILANHLGTRSWSVLEFLNRDQPYFVSFRTISLHSCHHVLYLYSGLTFNWWHVIHQTIEYTITCLPITSSVNIYVYRTWKRDHLRNHVISRKCVIKIVIVNLQ